MVVDTLLIKINEDGKTTLNAGVLEYLDFPTLPEAVRYIREKSAENDTWMPLAAKWLNAKYNLLNGFKKHSGEAAIWERQGACVASYACQSTKLGSFHHFLNGIDLNCIGPCSPSYLTQHLELRNAATRFFSENSMGLQYIASDVFNCVWGEPAKNITDRPKPSRRRKAAKGSPWQPLRDTDF